eukprot:3690403-Ditylum_brightwellii.AAC.1
MDFLPASVHDVTEVLLEKLHRRGGILMSTDDAVDLLETERFFILSQANKNNGVLMLENAVLTVPTSDTFFESAGFSTNIFLEWKNSNWSNEHFLQDAVECIDFLDNIAIRPRFKTA